MCFVRLSTAGLTDKNIAESLSEQNGVGSVYGNPISSANDRNHAFCFEASESSMYSDSPTEDDTTFCRLEIQEMAQSAIQKTCPDVECLLSLFSAQSESENPIQPDPEFLSYRSRKY